MRKIAQEQLPPDKVALWIELAHGYAVCVTNEVASRFVNPRVVAEERTVDEILKKSGDQYIVHGVIFDAPPEKIGVAFADGLPYGVGVIGN